MNNFEKTYQIEKHLSIELSDYEYLERFRLTYPKDMPKEMTEKAINIEKDSFLIDSRGKNEEGKSKTTKKKYNKNYKRTNKSTMATIQKKL